ncbi:MAG: hypothetical protein KGJ09_03435 [Candidatus Omnitrophica bacterium]|nr:hypothetical protein [Candidatus Omnitrophota bacterium]MDE2009111.1 hypothetical protein [Candidatus Omnitrophota bacterium]MDE2214224.1 hypothetical protein [Candidatus Omnitrophota bacterium]
MIRALCVLSCLLFSAAAAGFATPPTSISLAYDMGKGSLHVEALHESFNLTKSYVRLMYVYLNGERVLSRNYYKQDAYDRFTDDLPLTAKVGDMIKVDLFCTLGGEKAQELKVTSTGISQTQNAADEPAANGAAQQEE